MLILYSIENASLFVEFATFMKIVTALGKQGLNLKSVTCLMIKDTVK